MIGQAPPRASWLPWAELALGLAMATAGILHTLWALPHEWHELRLAAHHGVALLGCVVVLRALAEIGVKATFAGSLAAPGGVGRWERLRARLSSPRAEAVVGGLLMAAGFGQAYQLAVAPGPDDSVWHWGVALAGLLIALRSAHTVYEGLEHLGHAHVGPRWLRRVAHVVELPVVQLGMATAMLTLAGIEAALPVEPAAVEGAGAPVGHHGLAALGGLHLARVVPDFYNGSSLLWRRLMGGGGHEDAA